MTTGRWQAEGARRRRMASVVAALGLLLTACQEIPGGRPSGEGPTESEEVQPVIIVSPDGGEPGTPPDGTGSVATTEPGSTTMPGSTAPDSPSTSPPGQTSSPTQGQSPTDSTRPTIVPGETVDVGQPSSRRVPPGLACLDAGTTTIAGGQSRLMCGDVTVAGLTIQPGAALYFDPAASATLRSTANIVVRGMLFIKPADASIKHTIEFPNVDEGRFVGGGNQVLDTDVGLWVDAGAGGQLVAEGSPRRGWTNATTGVSAGQTQIEVEDATGWQVGDELSLSPTAPFGQDGYSWSDRTEGFHETTIAAIDGNTITLTTGPSQDHPMVAGAYSPEVMNLTRNVVIRGKVDGGGPAHLMIFGHHGNGQPVPQFLRWVALEGLGLEGDNGRYPLHFHHVHETTKGSLVEGVVARDSGGNVFVPHHANGITLRDTVAYDYGKGGAYWWDHNTGQESNKSDNILWEHTMAAAGVGEGYFLARGNNLIIRDAVAVRTGGGKNVPGFLWVNGSTGNWYADDLVAHNNPADGVRVWQNAGIPQIVQGLVAYHNGSSGIDQGAYRNRYVYRDVHLYGNNSSNITLHATSAAGALSFENVILDTAGITDGPQINVASAAVANHDHEAAVLYNIEFRGPLQDGHPLIRFANQRGGDGRNGQTVAHRLQLIDSSWPADQELVEFVGSGGSRNPKRYLQVIDDGGAVEHRDSGTTVIDRPVPQPFHPASQMGEGLLVEYFNRPDLGGEMVHSLFLPSLHEGIEADFKNGAPDTTLFAEIDVRLGWSRRMTGRLVVAPNMAGQYTFCIGHNRGVRMYLNGQLVIDEWDNSGRNGGCDSQHGKGYFTHTVDLPAGQHDVRIEINNPPCDGGSRGACYYYTDVMWRRAGGPYEVIQMNSLLPPPGVTEPNTDPEIGSIP